jgi:hypothetical protein
MTMGDWIASGILPGNGQTICTDFCRCAIVPVEWAGDFGDTKTVDTSIQKVQEIIEPFQDNLLLRWEVLMEKEVGFSDNPAEDLTKTMQLYNLSQNELAEKFPRRYALIQKILK